MARVLVGIAGFAAIGAVLGGLAWVSDTRDRQLAQDLQRVGVQTTAHDAEIWPACQARGCGFDADLVRATVELPTGPSVLELRGVHPDVVGLVEEEWSPAPAGHRYAGELEVRYDPEDPTRVMELRDLAEAASSAYVSTDRWITIGSVCVLAATLLAVLVPRPSSHGRHTRGGGGPASG